MSIYKAKIINGGFNLLLIKRGDKMEIYKFMSKLTNELNKNLFYNIEIDKDYNNYDKTYLIHIIADKDNKRYDYGFSIHENWLDDNSINELINFLLMQ